MRISAKGIGLPTAHVVQFPTAKGLLALSVEEADADLAARAREDHSAFDELHRRHRIAARGFVRVRARNDADADEIEQRTWIDVWTHLADYDRERAPLLAFVKYRASIALLRFYARTRHVVVLASQLIDRYPRSLHESDVWELITKGHLVAEADDFGSREDAKNCVRTHDRALELAFEDPVPPHQYLAFGFVKLLEWKPARLASVHRDTPLRDLAELFERQYLEISALPERRVRATFAALRGCMSSRFETIVHEARTLTAHQAVLTRVVGTTTLSDYAPRTKRKDGDSVDLEAGLYNWWYSVGRRTRKKLQSAGITKVPH